MRGVLLKPLVNRDETSLIYIRQTAFGRGTDNATFSVPEIVDLRAGLRTISSLGDFSTITFTMVGLGEPRQVRAGVVGGSYFDVMGLRPVRGRLLNAGDDGPKAAGSVVLTHRFWTAATQADPDVVGKVIRLGRLSATIVGVLEPSVPYPVETELIANVVTSPHHLSATMVTGREHRMTELFGRLAPGADLDAARTELRTVHAAMMKSHPEGYSPRADFRINAVGLRDQITSRARNTLLALLAEALLLCGAGGLVGVAIARPMVSVLSRYASRFSVRALDLTLDASLLWVGVGLALAAAVLLAYVPLRLAPLAQGRRAETAGCGRSQSSKLPRRSCSWPAPRCCCGP